jgi:hypothetical protein
VPSYFQPVDQVLVVCPRCREKGRIAPELLGQTVECAGCHSNFIAKRDFWLNQKFNSPILRHWWLGPCLLLASLVYAGPVSIWLALALVGIVLLAVIAHRLSVIAKK